VDFGQPQPPAGTPQIGCILDAADLGGAGPVARNQLLSVFGSGLGPGTGAIATDNSTTTLGGVSVNFALNASESQFAATMAAPLLYASSTQINLAVPLLGFNENFPVMQLTVNGVAATPIELPLELVNPSLFGVVLNQDGSRNSSSNGAPLGSTVSMLVNGLSGLPPEFPLESNIPAQLYASDGWSVKNIVPATPFVLRVDLQAPLSLPPKVIYCTPTPGQKSCIAPVEVSLYYLDSAAGGATNVTAQTVEESVYVLVPE
jgi:uncharacterized protein (TIGR03437 family)